MCSHWLAQRPSDSLDDPAAPHAEGEVDRAEQETRATIMRQVLVRSSGPVEGKRRWMRPPDELGATASQAVQADPC